MIQRVEESEAGSKPKRPRRKRRQRRGAVLRSIAVLPTMMTLGNALCGFAAIFVATRPEGAALPFDLTPLQLGCVLIFFGMVLDGLDGGVARLTRSTSDLGEQLDSMADMVTFGVAPAVLAVTLIGIETPFGGGVGDTYFDRLGLVAAMIYVACAALRLARFNVELGSEEQPDHRDFKGLPSPGAAGTVASLVLLHQHFIADARPDWVTQAAAFGMILVLLLTAFAMVSPLRYVHVLNRYVRGRAPFGTVVKAVVLGLLLVIEFQATLAGALIVYALSAPVIAGWKRVTGAYAH